MTQALNSLNGTRVISFVCWLLIFGAFSFGVALAQVPKIADLSDTLVGPIYQKLQEEHASLLHSKVALADKVKQHNAKCGSVEAGTTLASECAQEQAELEGQRRAYVDAVNRFNKEVAQEKCARLREQLERDKNALRRQLKSNEQALNELDTWTEANEKAQRDALKAGVTLLLGGFADQLEKQVKSARAFQGWMTRFDTTIRKGNVPLEAIKPKLERALSGYVSSMAAAKGGAGINYALNANDAWEMTRHEFAVLAEQRAKSDASVREVLNDPDFKKFVESDSAGSDLTENILNLASQSDALKATCAKPVALGTFIADYGYDATKWAISRARILQQVNLSEEELKAVYALKRQIESTVKELKDCDASSPK